MAQFDTEQAEPGRYAYDPHFDPMLVWSGKAEHDAVEVPTTSIHIHESVKPSKIIGRVQKQTSRDNPLQPALFGMTAREETELRNQAIEFYEHGVAWTNRLIAGDSLGVMNSLIQKEGMAGQLQTAYMDPPYGITYNSNFQPLANVTEVKDGKDDSIDSSPEMLTAFRDTWQLGIHSYLTYLRDRLKLIHELLADSGSVFVQISEANVHHVREVMDEVFGPKNFVSQILFYTTSGFSTTTLSRAGDYILWYAKNKPNMKYRQLYYRKNVDPAESLYRWLLLPDGSQRSMTKAEREAPSTIPAGSRIYMPDNIVSQGASSSSQQFEYLGKTYEPGATSHWKTDLAGMKTLGENGRLHVAANSLRYRRFADDFPYQQYTNVWSDTRTGNFTGDKLYVVQTSDKVISRCILMTSDPGDLVLDPTCGSGTTAYSAERLGRRWITIDTSRVSIEIAKKRLMTATYDYYELLHPSQGVDSGFVYEEAPHITLKSIAKGEKPETESLYDQPKVDSTRIRVSGPFTVEAPPSPVVISPTDEKAGSYGDAKQGEWMEELRANGILDKRGNRIRLSRLDMLEGTTYLAAEGETDEETPRSIVVCFGSDTKPMDRRVVDLAADEAATFKPRPDLVIIAAFQFDPEATDLIANLHLPRTELVAVQMNPDLLTADLRKKQRNGQGFTIIGQPDIKLEPVKSRNGQWRVNVAGFDYYDVKKGELTSGSAKDIAMWELDEDYDGLVFEPEQVFFPDRRNGWQDLAKTLRAEVDPTLIKAYSGTTSLPFTAAKGTRCAVKIIDNRGIESTAVLTIPMD
ncbi:site-specific DNA-methyltransferase [Bifidobacterium tissieri]|uniref:Site-specific DNA-methyltransferase n=2 Tax=Bifidobacterium tissieri TaxID=1630162 RepID=A0A5M9ZX35_9BIFI|nr:site-specific DNA-methyltransferase [Bifidobacterium tissieri]